MKLMKIMKLGIIFFVSLLFQISFAHSQNFIISNLDEEVFGHISLSSNFQVATSFRTGPEDSMLDGIVTRITNFDGGNEFVRIHNNVITNSVNQPGIEYATFQDSPDDLGSNQLRFTPNGDVSLSAMTTYWVVFGGGDFRVNYTISTAEPGNAEWEIGNSVYAKVNQGSWLTFIDTGATQFGIIIPETSNYVLIGGICLIAFAMFRRIRSSQTS